MDDRCCICLRRLPVDAELRARLVRPYGTAGRALVYVHRDQCEAKLNAGLHEVASFAFHGAKSLLHKKYPVLSGMVERFAAIRRAQREDPVKGEVVIHGRPR